ncbi:hypothetical protein [Treponema sp.]|uniref:hypothetical protein n=1 Tax=Treponema sp. TaxID=166 RepID=UPI0025D0E319|nr:hypothetical protein [Treponema sp.]MCR5217825.1 hypothetical protein [Treponema sp.]
MVIDEKVKNIMEWQDALTSYSDDYFFEIVRIYLGAVRTPFNKQNIVKQIANVLRQEESKKILLSYLTEEDVKILTAIKIIPDCTAKKLYLFFNSESVYEKLANLEDRLIVYHIKSSRDESVLLKINPMIKDEIEPYLGSGILFKNADNVEKQDSSFTVTKEFIAALLSYAADHGDCFKNDGTFKKKNQADIIEIFGEEKLTAVKVIFDALKNMSILYESEKGYEIEWGRMESLCDRDFFDILCYICVSAAVKFARSNLILYAELLKNILLQLKGKFYTSDEILQLAYLLKEGRGSDNYTTGRFSSMMAKVFETAESSGQIIESILDKALDAGLLVSARDTENGKEVFSSVCDAIDSGCECKAINLTPAGGVNLMPGLNLFSLVQLAKFMQIIRFDTVSSFEVNRRTAVRAFNQGMSVTKICELISSFSMYDVPQNLLLNLNEWNDSFSSTESYFGFILKVNDKQQQIQIEKNPVLASHILKLLAPGLYLFDFEDRLEAQSFIDKSGLDFIGEIKNSNKEAVKLVLQKLYADKSQLCSSSPVQRSPDEESLKSGDNFKKFLIGQLKKHELTQEQYDGLEDRIRRNLIISPEQLRAESVRFEITEATAMDHTGKIHVIESAMNNNDLLLISLRSNEKILGQIRSFNKKYDEASVRIFIEKLNVEQDIYIKNIMHVKRLRNPSVFVSKASDRW